MFSSLVSSLVYTINAGSKVILLDNQRGILIDQIESGSLAHIRLDNGTELYTNPIDIEAYISMQGWVDVRV